MNETHSLKLAVVEQNFILREKLANILSRNGNVGAVYQVADPANMEQVVMSSQPDIVLADIGAAEDMAAVIVRLRAAFPGTIFCVYSDFLYSDNQENVIREAALDLGADFFIDVVQVLEVIGGIIEDTAEKRTTGAV